MNKNILAASILAMSLGMSSSANAAFGFDIDGTGGSDGNLLSFDWLPGNFLAIDSVPTAEGLEFTGYFQAELSDFIFESGAVAAPVGAAGPYEYTAWAKLNELTLTAIDADGDGFNETVFFTHTGGTFEIWYDDFSAGSINADDLSGNSGLGYRDGQLVLSGSIQTQIIGAQFSVTELLDADGNLIPLDQFGTNDLAGISTVGGLGVTDLQLAIAITDYDQNFFLTDSLVQSEFDATLSTPFDSINPSQQILTDAGLVSPDYGPDNINGNFAVGTNPGTEDFHFETDGNQSFTAVPTVPEPSNLVLFGLGLALLGMSAKKGRCV